MKLMQISVLFVLVDGAACRQLGVTTPEERARCQCSTDGRSGGSDAFYFSSLYKTYESENIEIGGPYRFIGCGAHKYYRDTAERQIAGYPWRFCYTFGGKQGCKITETSQKHSLNEDAAYRFCDGDYDCQVQANSYVKDGTLSELTVLNETDSEGEGLLQDWTNCCRTCRRSPKECVKWDFDVETMECRLFSRVNSLATTETNSRTAPMRFSGTSGFDDAPVDCWFRNKYDTCKDNFYSLFIASMVLLSLGVVFMVLDFLGTRRLLATLGWTTDVTPTYQFQVPKTRSTKHGTETYLVPAYGVDLVYQFQNVMYRTSTFIEEQKIRKNDKFFFKKTPGGTLKPIGKFLPMNNCAECGCLFVMGASTMLFVISLQVFLSDGGRFQAEYVLPSANEGLWIAVFCLFSVVTGMLLFLGIPASMLYRKGYFCKTENTLTVLSQAPNVIRNVSDS